MVMFCLFCLKKDADPFMVAEVCSVDVENKSLCVNWWTPTSLSCQKQQLFPNMTFAPEMDKVHIKNRIRGAPMWRLSAKIQTIQFNMVYFSFNKFTNDKRLPPEVLRKLRDIGLIEKGTKIKRL